jgi:hypothetical protein
VRLLRPSDTARRAGLEGGAAAPAPAPGSGLRLKLRLLFCAGSCTVGAGRELRGDARRQLLAAETLAVMLGGTSSAQRGTVAPNHRYRDDDLVACGHAEPWVCAHCGEAGA